MLGAERPEGALCGDFAGTVDVDARCGFAEADDFGRREVVPVRGGECVPLRRAAGGIHDGGDGGDDHYLHDGGRGEGGVEHGKGAEAGGRDDGVGIGEGEADGRRHMCDYADI